MGIRQHIVLIAADNTDVFNGSIFETLPPNARTIRLQVIASDYDWLISASIGNMELLRDSAPHGFGADNLGSPEWSKPHCVLDVSGVGAEDIKVDVNVVTAGTGIVVLQIED